MTARSGSPTSSCLLRRRVGDTYGRNADATLHRVAGTAKNGVWTGSVLIPRWTNPGTWKVTEVDLDDAGGGFVAYAPGGGRQPWNSSWRSTFAVQATPDHKAPVVTSLHLSKTSVNTSSTAKTIDVRATATDAQSGVAGGLDLQAFTLFGGQGFSAAAHLTRTNGTSHRGTYVGHLTVPTWVGAGAHTWQLVLDAEDHVGNHVSVPSWALRQRGLASSFTVTSRGDSHKPTLTGLAISPTAVDARTHDRIVYATLKGADVGSGLSTAWLVLSSPSGYGVSSSNEGMPPSPVVNGGARPARDPAMQRTGYVDGQRRTGRCVGELPRVLAEPGQGARAAVQGHRPGARRDASDRRRAAQDRARRTCRGDVQRADVVEGLDRAVEGHRRHDVVDPVAGTWTCTNASHAVVGCNANGADVIRASFAPSAPLTIGRRYLVESFARDL